MIFTRFRAIAICFLMAIAAFVYAAERPVIKTHTMSGVAFQALSDNGQWALAWGAEKDGNSPVLVNTLTNQEITIQSKADMQANGECLAYDVTDDGNIVVGTYKAKPAYLNRSTGEWTLLPCRMVSGALKAVTPDGKYAVGLIANADVTDISYTLEQPAMWDLTTGEEITLAGLPTKDPSKNNLSQVYTRFTAVSPDGRYIVMQSLSDQYCVYVYDRESTADIKWSIVGYTTTNGQTFTKTIPELVEIEPVALSPNGKWLLCNALVNAHGDEGVCVLRYNVETKQTDVYDQRLEDMNVQCGCVDNDGNVYGATPYGSPLREFLVRSDGYWFQLRTILRSCYNMSFEATTGYENTGTPLAVSADGRTFISFSDPQYGENYIMRTNESLSELCGGINLLSFYSISPVSGSSFSSLSKISVTFDREVEVIGAQTAASFGDWKSLSGNGIYVDPTNPKCVIVAFRTRTLEGGKDYQFTIPAGTLCVKGDHNKTNAEITAVYRGRSNSPVAPLSIYPADGSILAKIDNSSSPVQITMDSQVKVSDNASAVLLSSDGAKLAQLYVSGQGNIVQIYPATTQYLFAGETYKVVLAAGSLTDLSGSGANEELTINYTGSYEREISTDNATIFADDFDNFTKSLATWMLYDNDHRTPAESMEVYEFDADNTPWNFSFRDNEASTDYFAGSHSIYSPAGRSDDWMVTPQLFIPDEGTTLSFLAQSLSSKTKDVLKVVVWESENVYNVLNAETFAKLSSEGETVFEETLSPGATENVDGEWTSYSVSLAKYAGKSVYIAFVNQNSNQGMVFVNDVKVTRDMAYMLTLTNKNVVVNETEINIAGKLTVNTQLGFNGGFSLTLCDAEGNAVDTYEYKVDGMMSAETAQNFSFAKPLPLVVGENNKFSLKIEYVEGENTEKTVDEVKSSVMSLTFNPQKRVVLEEMTGTTCGNCPQGIIAIDKMKELYGEQFIPISIHTYDGDAWGAGLYGYSSSLGLLAAPTGIVNRSGDVCSPMMKDPFTFKYTLSFYGYLWMDRVAEELNTPTYIDVSATVTADRSTGRFSVPLTVRSALNAVNMNLNVFLVFMEDRLTGLQHNYFASESDPLLGEWGKGGLYGQSTVSGVVHNDVVRYVYGGYSGASGLLPQSMKAGEEYEVTLSGELPGTYENFDNTKFAIILIDANTDKIVNACVAYTNPAASIQTVEASASSKSTGVYTISGVKVSDMSKPGVYVVNGKKIVVK